MASQAENQHLSHLESSAQSGKDGSPTLLAHHPHYQAQPTINHNIFMSQQPASILSAGVTGLQTVPPIVHDSTPKATASTFPSFPPRSQSSAFPTELGNIPDKGAFGTQIIPTILGGSSTQPISIPTTGSSPHVASSTIVFQQVTPFGTPSVSSLSSSFISGSAFSQVAKSLTATSGAHFPDPLMMPMEDNNLFSLGPTQPTMLSVAASLPMTSLTTSSNYNRPKLKKCPIDECFDKVAKIIGDCKFCELQFCSLHRLPEQHRCSHIVDVKKASFDRNSSKLLKEKCVADKV